MLLQRAEKNAEQEESAELAGTIGYMLFLRTGNCMHV